MAAETTCCATCGFFDHVINEAGETACCTEVHRSPFGYDPNKHGKPHCGKGRADLDMEWRRCVEQLAADRERGNIHVQAVAAITRKARQEGCWMKWNPLLTPKEHEMQYMFDKAAEYSRRKANVSLVISIIALIAAFAAPVIEGLASAYFIQQNNRVPDSQFTISP